MTETTDKGSSNQIPIVKRRSELKRQVRQLKLSLRDKESELERLERHIYLETEFQSNKSDLAGRKREIQTILENNSDYQEILSEVHELRAKLEEQEDIVSNINFFQRERLVIAADRYEKAVENLSEALVDFVETIHSFNESVEKFVAARSR